MSTSRLTSAPDVICYINNVLVGKVTGIAYNLKTSKRKVYGIDLPYAQESVPTTVEANITLNLLKYIADGSTIGIGIQAGVTDISKLKYFSITLVDRRIDTTILQLQYCTCDNESWQVMAKNLLAGAITVDALLWTTELS